MPGYIHLFAPAVIRILLFAFWFQIQMFVILAFKHITPGFPILAFPSTPPTAFSFDFSYRSCVGVSRVTRPWEFEASDDTETSMTG